MVEFLGERDYQRAIHCGHGLWVIPLQVVSRLGYATSGSP
jgi:hypothetical protein